jgi:hypothetical protein
MRNVLSKKWYNSGADLIWPDCPFKSKQLNSFPDSQKQLCEFMDLSKKYVYFKQFFYHFQ